MGFFDQLTGTGSSTAIELNYLTTIQPDGTILYCTPSDDGDKITCTATNKKWNSIVSSKQNAGENVSFQFIESKKWLNEDGHTSSNGDWFSISSDRLLAGHNSNSEKKQCYYNDNIVCDNDSSGTRMQLISAKISYTDEQD